MSMALGEGVYYNTYCYSGDGADPSKVKPSIKPL